MASSSFEENITHAAVLALMIGTRSETTPGWPASDVTGKPSAPHDHDLMMDAVPFKKDKAALVVEEQSGAGQSPMGSVCHQ